MNTATASEAPIEEESFDSGKISCAECDAECHSISLHLRDFHGPDSEKPITFELYKVKHPDSPVLSQKAKARLAQRVNESKIKSVLGVKSTSASGSTLKAPMAKLFALGNIKAAKTENGDDIMIDLMDQEGFEEYIPKTDDAYVYPVDTLKSLLMAFSQNIPAYIYGHSGVGKSTIFEQICGHTRRRMIRVQHTVNTEESHIVGQWTVRKFKDPKTEEFINEMAFELGPLPLAMKNGWTYLADEYDRGYPSVLSVYQAVLEGKALFIKEADAENRIIEPHPDFRFVATGNTNGSGDETGLYQATVVQDAATFERFGVVERMTYMSKRQEMEIVKSQAGVIERDAERIIDFCQSVRDGFPNTVSLTIGPRVAINIAKIGLMRGDFKKGVELSYANRLPETERTAAMQIAQRYFG